MIATEFYEGQGLGNQLWVYAACRSIAEQLGMNHLIIKPERFKGHSFLDIDVGSLSYRDGNENPIDVFTWPIFNEEIFFDPELNYFSSGFDRSVHSLQPNTRIHGLFDDISRLKKYVQLKKEFQNMSIIGDDCCIVNIRGGEYKRHRDLILPKSYWVNAIHNMTERYGITNFIAVSDDDRYVQAMFPDLPILRGSMEHDYTALYQAKFAIIANSSWCYFPAKTGIDKTCVIAPMYWSRFGNELNRWAAPANLYESWLWQDDSGVLHTHKDCTAECKATDNYYRSHYFVRSTPDQLLDKGLRRFVPASIRKLAKRLLSVAFPKRFG